MVSIKLYLNHPIHQPITPLKIIKNIFSIKKGGRDLQRLLRAYIGRLWGGNLYKKDLRGKVGKHAFKQEKNKIQEKKERKKSSFFDQKK